MQLRNTITINYTYSRQYYSYERTFIKCFKEKNYGSLKLNYQSVMCLKLSELEVGYYNNKIHR